MINYENNDFILSSNDTHKLKENHFLLPTHCFRMAMIGSSGCGKGNLFVSMLRNLLDYDNLYIITPSLQDQPIYQKLSELSEKSKHIKCYTKICDFDLEEVDSSNNETNIIVFDDVMCEKKTDQEYITKCFSWGRHKNCSVIYISQAFFSIPKNIRLNCSHYTLFSLGDESEIDYIRSKISRDISLPDFRKMYQEAVLDEKHSFMYIDKNNPIKALKYRKRFDQLLLL
jgi:hypothetical protein